MKILCIGDSGTRGSVGVSYVKAIKRGLHVTIDGGHLNSVEAQLFRQAVEEQLLLLAKTHMIAGSEEKRITAF